METSFDRKYHHDVSVALSGLPHCQEFQIITIIRDDAG